MKSKDLEKLTKITTHYELIVRALEFEEGKWYQVNLTGWAKNTKDGIYLDGPTIFVNGESKVNKRKKWWKFWVTNQA